MMPLPPQVPRRGGGISRRVAAALLRLLGWRIAGSVPDVAKCVVVAVPHTSNFDGLYVLPAMLALDLKMSIFGKRGLFAVPGLAAFLRYILRRVATYFFLSGFFLGVLGFRGFVAERV